MTAEKDTRRQTARILVKAVLEWGGVGRDVAGFLGVSPTTISHWRSTRSGAERKVAVPTDEHLVKLMGILEFRVNQNLSFLEQMIRLGGLDRSTSVLVARTIGPRLTAMGKYCDELQDDSAFDAAIDKLKEIQSVGGTSVLRSLLNMQARWESEKDAPPPAEQADVPLDLEQIRAQMHVDQAKVERVRAAMLAYQEYITEKARKAYLFPNESAAEAE